MARKRVLDRHSLRDLILEGRKHLAHHAGRGGAALKPDSLTSLLETVRTDLQAAIELEFATIPVYLSGLFTIKPGQNAEVGNILTDVVNQEMLHMCLAANALIAVGGEPAIYPTCIPTSWPTTLPFDVDDGLEIGIQAVSNDVVFNTYMAIEAPQSRDVDEPSTGGPIPLPDNDNEFNIAVFYDIIIALMTALPSSAFGNLATQVPSAFGLDTTITATNFASQLQIIIDQGEGTATSVTETVGEAPNEIAHFYQFAQIKMGNMIVIDNVAKTYAFSGLPVTVDPSGVYNMPANFTLAAIPSGTPAHAAALAFAQGFDTIVQQLQTTFNGTPSELGTAVGSMFNLPGLAATCMTTAFGTAGQVTPLCFQAT